MTSRIFALLVCVAILGATAPIRAGQVGDEPQFRVRIETSNLDSLRESLERAGYDVLGTDTDELDDRGRSLTLRAIRSLQPRAVRRLGRTGPPVAAGAADKAEASGQQLMATAAVVSAGYLNLDGVNDGSARSPRRTRQSRRSST